MTHIGNDIYQTTITLIANEEYIYRFVIGFCEKLYELKLPITKTPSSLTISLLISTVKVTNTDWFSHGSQDE